MVERSPQRLARSAGRGCAVSCGASHVRAGPPGGREAGSRPEADRGNTRPPFRRTYRPGFGLG